MTEDDSSVKESAVRWHRFLKSPAMATLAPVSRAEQKKLERSERARPKYIPGSRAKTRNHVRHRRHEHDAKSHAGILGFFSARRFARAYFLLHNRGMLINSLKHLTVAEFFLKKIARSCFDVTS